MSVYDKMNRNELISMIKQKDRQLEGERIGSQRTLTEIERLKSEIYHLKDAWKYATKDEIFEALPIVIPKIIKGEEWSI